MISTSTPEPQVDFWEELTIKVQEIQRRTGQEAPRHVPRQQSIRKKRFSRFQVEEAWHRSQQEAQSLANRIKYLNAEQARHSRNLNLAKLKYERMMAVRERSLREKDQCRKRISEINEEISKEVEGKVMKAREERFRVTQSVQKVREKNQVDAHEIRQLSTEIDKVLKQEREIEVEQKKEKVVSARESMEQSRMKLSQLQEDRVKLGKVEHKETIRKQLTLNLHQHRRNSLLRQKLEESIITAENNKHDTLSRLREYQSIMEPSPKRPPTRATAITIST